MGINLTSRCSNFKRPNLIRFWYNKRFWFQISNSQAESRRNNSSDHQTNSTGRNTIYRYILQLCVLIYMYIQSFSLIDVNFNCMFYNILIKLIIQRRFLCIFKNKQKSSMFYFKSNYCYLSQEIFYTLTFRLKVFFIKWNYDIWCRIFLGCWCGATGNEHSEQDRQMWKNLDELLQLFIAKMDHSNGH